jgi:hypothetical protein
MAKPIVRSNLNWDAFDHGSSSRQDSVTSNNSHVHFDEDEDPGDNGPNSHPQRDQLHNDGGDGLGRRRHGQDWIHLISVLTQVTGPR